MNRSPLSIDPPASDPEFCPHLGLKDDAQTCMGYPSTWNYCHHCRPIAVVQLTHQHDVCLTSAYKQCPVFQSPKKMHMPAQYREAPWWR